MPKAKIAANLFEALSNGALIVNRLGTNEDKFSRLNPRNHIKEINT